MKNRLQFRYHSDIFFNRELAYEYLTETINNKHDERSFSSLIAEPLVAYYYDANGDTQVLFLIGVNGNGEQPVNENTNYFILDGAKMNETISELEKNSGLDHNRIVALETALQEEIDRAKKKEQDLETSVNKLVRNIESETEARRNVDGQVGPKYLPNLGTTAEPIKYISSATSLNHADMILDQSIQKLDAKALNNINVNGVDGLVKNNVASVVIGGKDIILTDYVVGTNNHPVTKTDSINSAFGKIQVQINETQANIGLNEDGTYKQNMSAAYIKDAKTLHEATELLDETIEKLYGGDAVEGMETIHKIGFAIQKETNNRIAADNKLTEDVNKNKTDISTINTYSINNKFIKNNPILNGTDIKLDNYIASAGVSDITPNDTVNIGLGKLETRVKSVQTNLDAEVKRASDAEKNINDTINTINSNIISLQDDLSNLNGDINNLSGVVNANKVINNDGSLQITESNNTNVSVRIAEGDNALKLTINGLMVDKSALTTYNGENAIVVDLPDSNNNRKVSLKVNTSDKVLVNDGAGLRTDISMSYEKEAQRIRLYGKNVNGTPIVISEISVADFIADSMIEDVKYDKTTSILTITWNTISGQKPVEIDFSDLIDVYTAGNGLTIDANNKFHVVVDEDGCDKINNVPILSSTENGLKIVGVAASITNLINETINNNTLITTEAQLRKESDTILTSNISVVSGHVMTLQTEMTAVENSLNSESARAVTRENEIEYNLNLEITERRAVDDALNKDVAAIYNTINGINNKIDTNISNISDLDKSLGENVILLTNEINENKKAIENLNADYTIDGSIKHMVLDSLVAIEAMPTADDAKDQSLLRQIPGTNQVYASNSTKDMMHENNVLSTVINSISGKTIENAEEIDTLKKRVNTLEKEMIVANNKIETLENEIIRMQTEFEQKVINLMLKTIIGTEDEIKISKFIDPSDEKHRIKIGFADDAIFNANTK